MAWLGNGMGVPWAQNAMCESALKRLRTLLFWAFNHNLIPQLLLTARLGLGIQQTGSKWVD